MDQRYKQSGIIRVWAEPWCAAWETFLKEEAPLNTGWEQVDAHLLSWMVQRAIFAPPNSILRVRTDSLYQEIRQLCVMSESVVEQVVMRAKNTSNVIVWNDHPARNPTKAALQD